MDDNPQPEGAVSPQLQKSERYTIIVRDEEFSLTRNQLELDAPNYFTTLFFGDFMENGRKTVNVDRNPDLFAILVEYMSGYSIIPLSERALPRTMDIPSATRNLALDAAFYGFSRLHSMLTAPQQPAMDFSWTGFSAHVIRFEDVLQGSFPQNISYTTSGLCSFDCGAVKPVIIYGRNLALRLIGNLDLDMNGRPGGVDETTASFQLCLTPATKAQLSRQHYSAFEYSDDDPLAITVSVLPESRLHIDDHDLRFEHFAHWWRVRRAPRPNFVVNATEDQKVAEAVFDDSFPTPFEDSVSRGDFCDRNEFTIWADELLFVITARGFIAGTLQLHMKLLDVRARTRARVLRGLKPLVTM